MGWRQWLDRRKEQAQKMASKAPSPEVLAERLARACAEGLEDEARKLLSMGAGHGDWAGRPAWKWAAAKAAGVFVEVAAKAPAARYEESPLHWAIENGRADAVQALAGSPQGSPTPDDLLRALKDAAQLGRIECAQWLVRFAPELRAVHVAEWAIDSGSPECVNAVMLALKDRWGEAVFCDAAFDVLACEAIRAGGDWTQPKMGYEPQKPRQ